MTRFTIQQRVTVTGPAHHLTGMSGIVVRLRHADNAAWVEMDTDLPAEFRAFPNSDSRARHALLYPDECSPS